MIIYFFWLILKNPLLRSLNEREKVFRRNSIKKDFPLRNVVDVKEFIAR